MIDLTVVRISGDYDKDLFNIITNSVTRQIKKKRKQKKKKEITEVGQYCPKEKPGMAWSYTKDKKEKEDEQESDVD